MARDPPDRNSSKDSSKKTSKKGPKFPRLISRQSSETKRFDRTPNGYFRHGGTIWRCVICNTEVGGSAHDISTHNSKMHRANSAYAANQDISSPVTCDHRECFAAGKAYANFNSYLGHWRKKHNFRGKSAGLKVKFQNGGREPADEDEDEAEGEDEDDESLFVDDLMDFDPPDRAPNNDDDGGPGPSAGGSIPPIAV